MNKAYLNVDACDFFGDTLLFTAARLKDPEILMALLEKNPKNINATNEYGFTAFSFFMSRCYRENYLDFMKRKQLELNKAANFVPKLKSGLDNAITRSLAEYDKAKKSSTFPFFEDFFSEEVFQQTKPTFRRSAYPVVEKFIEHKADINVKNPENGRTPLHYAVKHGDMDTVRSILNYDSSTINELDLSGLTALYYAIQNKNTSIIKLLIKKGAKVNFEDLKQILKDPQMSPSFPNEIM